LREKTANSREAIVETATELFGKQGYHGTGLNQIVKESQCPKGSLYYYFPEGKVELALESIRRTKNKVSERWERFFAASDNPAQAIRRIIEETAMEAEHTDFKCFLPFSFWTAVEASYVNDKLREAWLDVFTSWQGVLSRELKRFGIRDELAGEAAMTVMSLLEGAVHLTVTSRDTRPLLNASKHMDLYLDHLVNHTP